jgi:hypothetical protein
MTLTSTINRATQVLCFISLQKYLAIETACVCGMLKNVLTVKLLKFLVQSFTTFVTWVRVNADYWTLLISPLFSVRCIWRLGFLAIVSVDMMIVV